MKTPGFIFCLALLSTIQTTTQDEYKFNNSILDVYVVADSNILTEQDVYDFLRTANDIVSAEIKLHIRVVGKLFRTFDPDLPYNELPPNVPEIDTGSRYPSFEHLLVFKGKKEVLAPNFTLNHVCAVDSRGFIPLQTTSGSKADHSQLARMSAASIFLAVSYDKHRSCPCDSPDSTKPNEKCLSDDPEFKSESSGASSCYKEHYEYLFKTHHFYIECIWGRDAKRETKFPLCGNGIQEEGETCDCYHDDKGCKASCDTKTCGVSGPTDVTHEPDSGTSSGSGPEEGPSKRTNRLYVVLGIIALLVLIGVVIGTVIYTKKRAARKRHQEKLVSTQRSNIQF